MRKFISAFIAAAVTANVLAAYAADGAELSADVTAQNINFTEYSDIYAASPEVQFSPVEGKRFTLVSDPYDGGLGLYAASETESETFAFYSYSNDLYETEYGTNGLGWAYQDIAADTRRGTRSSLEGENVGTDRSYADLRKEMYIDLLAWCKAFAANYTDLQPTYYNNGEGDYFERYQLPGSANTTYAVDTAVAVETYFTFRHDHPEYYWLSSTFSPLLSGGEVIFTPEIDEEFRSGEYRRQLDTRMQETIDWFTAQIDDTDYTDYQKAKLIHDTICTITDYGYEEDGVTPLDTPVAHSIVSVLDADPSTDAVCEGHAKAFELLCSYAGIETVFVVGEITTGAHAWNMVKLGDTFYYVDVTLDDQDYGVLDVLFAANADTMSDTAYGAHRAYADTAAGHNFLYALPAEPSERYMPSAAETSLEPQQLPERGSIPQLEPSPTDVISSIETPIWINAADLIKKTPNTLYYKDFGDLYRIAVTVKRDGAALSYGDGFYAAYDGKNMAERYFKLMGEGNAYLLGEPIDFTKLVIKVEKGCEVSAAPSYRSISQPNGYIVSADVNYSDGTVHKKFLGSTVIAGEKPDWYGYEIRLSDVAAMADENVSDWSALYQYSITDKSGTALTYGTDYYCEYDGAELVDSYEYEASVYGYVTSVIASDAVYRDVLDKMILRSRVPMDCVFIPGNADESGNFSYHSNAVVSTSSTERTDETEPDAPQVMPTESPVIIGIPDTGTAPTPDTGRDAATELERTETGVTVKVTPYKDISEAVLLTAAYNEDGTLNEVVCSPLSDLKAGETTELDIKVGTGTSPISCFMMDSLKAMIPLAEKTNNR